MSSRVSLRGTGVCAATLVAASRTPMSVRPDTCGRLAPIRSLTISSGALVDHSTLHDEGNIPKASEIGQGIALDRNDVGILSGRNGAYAVLPLHQQGGGQRGRADSLQTTPPDPDGFLHDPRLPVGRPEARSGPERQPATAHPR